MADDPIPVVIAPATVVAPQTQSETELDAASRRTIAERASPHTTAEEDRHTA